MSDNDSGRAGGFDELALEVLRRIEEEGWCAYEEALRTHPQHRERLEKRVRALVDAGLLDVPAREPLRGVAGADAGSGARQRELPETLGDFRILDTLGEGGMGVVYLAEEVSLSRQVALKLVRPEQLYFPGARERFEREVAIVAGLQHPGIVPVYSFGEAQGIPYFAMERVRGATLGDVLERLVSEAADPAQLTGGDLARVLAALSPAARDELDTSQAERGVFAGSWSHAVSEIGRAIAEALEHAHRRGVLHRDVKPSNIMLTSAGRAMLLDFGLSSSAVGDRLTRTGSQVGSLPYMPPEAFHARSELDERSDVYALGVTLYELLTLRLPYEAGSGAELVRAIQSADRPAARARNAQVPRDLETVVETAMDADPLRRYATAAELAGDLSNVLEARPIEARRSGAVHRLRLWARRHPAAATASAALLLGVLIGPSALAWQQHKAGRVIRAERDTAREARALADRSYERAIDAVEAMLAQVGDQVLLEIPGMERVRRELLEAALRLHEAIAQDSSGDPAQRLRVAKTLFRTAGIHAYLGQRSLAIEALERELAVLSELELEAGRLAESAGGGAERRGWADEIDLQRGAALFRMAEAQRLEGLLEESESSAREGLARLERVSELEPDLAEFQGRLRIELAWTLASQGRAEEARNTLLSAIKELESMLANPPESQAGSASQADPAGVAATEAEQTGDDPALQVKRLIARALRVLGQGNELAFFPERRTDTQQSLAQLERARELQTEVVAATGSLADRHVLGDICNVLGTLYMGAQLTAEGREVLEQSAEQFEALADDFPSVRYYRQALGTAWMNQIMLMRFYEQAPGWRALAERTVELFEELCEQQPENGHYASMRFYARSELTAGFLLDGPPDYERAYATASRGLSEARELVARGLATPGLRHKRLNMTWVLGEAAIGAGRLDEAYEAVLAALELGPPIEEYDYGIGILASALAASEGDEEAGAIYTGLAAELVAEMLAGGVERAAIQASMAAEERRALAARPAIVELLEAP